MHSNNTRYEKIIHSAIRINSNRNSTETITFHYEILNFDFLGDSKEFRDHHIGDLKKYRKGKCK